MPKSRNQESAPDRSSPRDTFELALTDVYLVVSDGQDQAAVPGFRVIVDQLGLTLLKPDGRAGAVIPWTGLTGLGVMARTETDVGQPACLVEAATAGARHRFVVPTDDAAGLESVLAELVAGKIGGGGVAKRSRWSRRRR